MAASDKLTQEMHEAAKKPKVEGSQEPITDVGDSTPASATPPRRPAAHGGSDASMMQTAIGGPFGGRTGSAETKAASIDKLPI